MKNRALSTLFAVAVMFVALTAPAQQQYETLKKGFQPDKVYQFNDIDHVNVFNGNLVITLPIGLKYPLNGGLNYGLVLTYNSKVWDLAPGPGGTTKAYPALRSNAGFGWVLGMGRFIPRFSATNLDSADIYEAPDGGDHRFPGPQTSDGTALRLRTVETDGSGNRTKVEIDSPDGVIRRFEKNSSQDWPLRSVRTLAGNEQVTVTPGTSPIPSQCATGTSSFWTITDSELRTHYVCFKNRTVDGASVPMVDRVVLSSIDSSSTLPTYVFHYTDNVNLGAPAEDTDFNDPSWSRMHTAPTLDSVTLADNSTFEMKYAGAEDAISSLTLPTRGRYTYSYGDYAVPSQDICANDHGLAWGFGMAARTKGVIARTFVPAVPAGRTEQSATWYYTPQLSPAPNTIGYQAATNCTPPTPEDPNVLPTHPNIFNEFIVTVTDPAGNYTDNHFTVYANDYESATYAYVSPDGHLFGNYGQPYGISATSPLRYLSQEIYDCSSGTCGKKREVWVRHEPDADPANPETLPFLDHRLMLSRTVFVDDSSHWINTAYSDWDGYLHYRTETLTSDYSSFGTRTTTTSWNKNSDGSNKTFADTDPWILNTHRGVTVSDSSGTKVEQACFNANGFQTGRRLLLGSSPAAGDMLVRLTPDATTGNLVGEDYFGGDKTPLSGSTATDTDLCTALSHLTGSAAYSISHDWDKGQMKTSQYANVSFLSMDLTIDPSGLITKARDTSGLETTYHYDPSGRLSSIVGPDSMTTTLTYANAASHTSGSSEVLDTAASVDMVVTNGTTTGGHHIYQYDSLGRLWREKTLMPSGTWSFRETLYDVMSRNSTRSELETLTVPSGSSEYSVLPQHTSSFTYDGFGRTTSITGPDSKRTTSSWTGTRSMTRTIEKMALATGEGPASTIETYDPRGRLVSVEEDSNSTASDHTKTSYTYDVADHLTGVSTQVGSAAPVQTARAFSYDNRGVLLSETHPENGTTTYGSYDARGHVGKQHAGTPITGTATGYDLLFTYDAAERQTAVDAVSPSRNLKTFTYAADNGAVTINGQSVTDYVKGKLQTARRATYDSGYGDFAVTETYNYTDAVGRLTRKTTEIDRLDPLTLAVATVYQNLTQSYAYDLFGNRSDVTYPTCNVIPCGLSNMLDNKVTATYTNEHLTNVSGYAGTLGYAGNGLLSSVSHNNGVTMTQTGDPYGQPRPHAITVSNFSTCTNPSVSWSASPALPVASGTAVTLTATVTGSPSFHFEWFDSNGTRVSVAATYTTPPITADTTYRLVVTNDCGVATVYVFVPVCRAPSIDTPPAGTTINAGQTATLSVAASGNSALSFQWYQGTAPDTSTPVGSGGTSFTTAALTTTTNYWVRVSSSCGLYVNSTTATVTVNSPLSTPANFSATRRVLPNQSVVITASWSAVTGADHYLLQRQTGSGGFQPFQSVNGTTTDDATCPNGSTCVYRVQAANASGQNTSSYSSNDLATMMAFTSVTGGTPIAAAQFEELRTALNAMRATHGDAALSWASILPAGTPAPSSQGFIDKAHVNSMRSAMDSALQQLGVAVPSGPAVITGDRIAATHVQQLQSRAQ